MSTRGTGQDPLEPGALNGQPAAKQRSSTPAPNVSLDTFLVSVEHRAYRFALYDLRDRELALDVVQDSMLKLVERYNQRPSSEWPALFFTILRNRITDAKRWRLLERVRSYWGATKATEPSEESDVLDTLPAPEHEAPDARLSETQQRATIEQALGQLTSRQRHVFLLREWQELSVKETAHVLGCSIGSVKQHHFRALQHLRRQLSEVER